MKVDKTIYDAVIPSGVALVADVNLVEVDLQNLILSREFTLQGKIVPNATAVGADRWVDLNLYFSDEKITTPETYVPLLHARRKFSSGPLPLSNATLANNGTQYFKWAPAVAILPLTITASTTTATINFFGRDGCGLNVGDLIKVSGGVVTGDGAQMQGVFKVATVVYTSTAGAVVTQVTYAITSTTGTLVGATVQALRSSKFGKLPMDGILRPISRYMYVSMDRSALDASSTIAVTLKLVRVPSPSVG